MVTYQDRSCGLNSQRYEWSRRTIVRIIISEGSDLYRVSKLSVLWNGQLLTVYSVTHFRVANNLFTDFNLFCCVLYPYIGNFGVVDTISEDSFAPIQTLHVLWRSNKRASSHPRPFLDREFQENLSQLIEKAHQHESTQVALAQRFTPTAEHPQRVQKKANIQRILDRVRRFLAAAKRLSLQLWMSLGCKSRKW